MIPSRDRARPRAGFNEELVNLWSGRLAVREFADLKAEPVVSRMMAVDLVTAFVATDMDALIATLSKITRISAGIEQPESAADRRPVRIEDSEDWATTRVRRSRPKE